MGVAGICEIKCNFRDDIYLRAVLRVRLIKISKYGINMICDVLCAL